MESFNNFIGDLDLNDIKTLKGLSDDKLVTPLDVLVSIIRLNERYQEVHVLQ